MIYEKFSYEIRKNPVGRMHHLKIRNNDTMETKSDFSFTWLDDDSQGMLEFLWDTNFGELNA